MRARTGDGTLVCQLEACTTRLLAATGFQELLLLQAHVRDEHGAEITMGEAQTLRASWERVRGGAA